MRRLGFACGMGVALLGLIYAGVLAVGLARLPAPGAPIGEPWFSAMEALILAIAPAMLGLFLALRNVAPSLRTSAALAGMAMMTALTCVVHGWVLATGAGRAAFRWPALPYALDILAWDGLFAFAVLAAAPVFPPAIRRLLIASGMLALLGLAGPLTGVMALRMVGVFGYAVLFPIAALAMARWFARA